MGSNHSSALSATGRVFTWGRNYYGHLGNGSKIIPHISLPTEITSNLSLAAGDKLVSISMGSNHSSALSATGRVFTWGSNFKGQLGDRTTIEKALPTEITSNLSLAAGDKIVSIALGYDQSIAISDTGRVFRWGLYSFRTEYSSYNITYINSNYSESNDTYDSIPTEITSLFSIAADDKVVAISFLRFFYSLVLSSTGRVFIRHKDYSDYKNKKPTEITSKFNLSFVDKIVAISLGYEHYLALSAAGRVFTWGRNKFGELGEGTTDKTYPIEITSKFKLT
jgi:alpha-tubulin suppressor-like RCC1 family protein